MKQSSYIVVLVLLVLVGAGSFYGGMKYQQNKQPSRADFQSRMGMRQGTLGIQRPAGSGMVRGEIIDKDETTMTVKLPDESSKIVLISENTEINKATEGSVDDLQTGEQVMVFGQTNSDGSVSATQIQLDFGFGLSQSLAH